MKKVRQKNKVVKVEAKCHGNLAQQMNNQKIKNNH